MTRRRHPLQILEKCHFYTKIDLEKCKKNIIFILEKCILFVFVLVIK